MRKEKDLLGSMLIGNDLYYGINTMRALNNFKVSSTRMYECPELIYSLLIVKKSTALANNELKVLDDKKCEAIVSACDKLTKFVKHDQDFIKKQFPLDSYQGGAGTSVNMNANEVIANMALEYLDLPKGEYKVISPNDHVNMSQSTNDAYPTSFTISIIMLLEKLKKEIKKMMASLKNKANEFKNIYKVGRTQLQDAVPMTVGQEFNAFYTLMEKEIVNINRNIDLLYSVNIGATAIGTSINAPKKFPETVVKYLRKYSTFPLKLADDLIEATSETTTFLFAHNILKRTAIKLGKISNDLRLLSSGPRAGLHEINLPEVQAGSSIMPGKVNPVIPEVVNQICFKVMGNDLTIASAVSAAQLQLNYAEPVIAQSMFGSFLIVQNGLKILRKHCIDGITVNKDICESYVSNSIGLVTYLNPYLGHELCDLIAKEAYKTKKSIKEIVLKYKYLDEKTLDKALDFRKY